MGMRALVTGAGGFIGSHLVEELVHEGYDVRAFVHYNSNNNWYNLEKLPTDTVTFQSTAQVKQVHMHVL